MKQVIADTPREQEIADMQTRRFELQNGLSNGDYRPQTIAYSQAVEELKQIKRKLNHYYIHEKGLGR